MAEYIDRETLIEFVKKYSANINGETTLKCVEIAIRNAPTEDVVPRSEVEKLEQKLKDQDLTNMILRANLHSPVIERAKQEVAREILGEIDFVFNTIKMEMETHIGEAIVKNDLSTASAIQYGKDVICVAEKALLKALKKYIGE